MAIEFTKETFGSLLFEEFSGSGKWFNIGLHSLSTDEQEIIFGFIRSVTGAEMRYDLDGNASFEGFEINWDDILLVKANDSGSIDRVYGAALFRKPDTENEMILQLGSNQFPISLVPEERKRGSKTLVEMVFDAGNCSGEIEFAEKTYKVKLDEGTEGEEEIEISPATLILTCSETDRSYAINVRLENESKPTKDRVTAAIKAQTIAQVLATPSSGSSGGKYTETLKMQFMQAGEYKVTGIRELDGQYGLSYIIKLAGGSEVWSRGGCDTLLQNPTQYSKILDRLNADEPVTLAILDIKQRQDGKFYVDCTFRLRDPIVPTAAAGTIPVKPIAPPATVPIDKAKVAAAIGAKSSMDSVDLDEIPF